MADAGTSAAEKLQASATVLADKYSGELTKFTEKLLETANMEMAPKVYKNFGTSYWGNLVPDVEATFSTSVIDAQLGELLNTAQTATPSLLPGPAPLGADITGAIAQAIETLDTLATGVVVPSYVAPTAVTLTSGAGPKYTAPSAFAGVAPTLATSFTAPTRPNEVTFDVPALADVSLDRVTKPTLANVVAPSINTITMGAISDLVSEKVDWPVLTPIAGTLPDAPDIKWLEALTPDSIVLPSIDAFVIPEYYDRLPKDFIPQPTEMFHFEESEYETTALEKWKDRVYKEFDEGGYGIDEKDEIALYAREADRQMSIANAAMAEATRTAASRGFSMPPGALMAQLAAARQEGMRNISTASRDIAIDRAKLYRDHRRYIWDMFSKTEETEFARYTSRTERMLNTSKAVAEFAVALYNAKVSQFNTMLETAKVGIATYEAKVRAVLGRVETEKLHLQAAATKVDLERVKIQAFSAGVDGKKAETEVYRTSAEIAKIKSDIELEGQRLTLQSYTAKIEGKRANTEIHRANVESAKAYVDASASVNRSNVEAFTASIGAQKMVVDMYRTEVEAAKTVADTELGVQRNQVENFRAQVESARAVAGLYQSDITAMQSLIEAEKSKMELFKLEIGAYSERIRASTLELQSFQEQVKGDALKVDLFRSQVESKNAEAGVSRIVADVAKTKADVSIEVARMAVAAASAGAEIYRANAQGVAMTNQATVSAYGARTEAFRALAGIYESAGRVSVAKYDASARTGIENARNILEQQKAIWAVKSQASIAGSDAMGKGMQAALNQVIGIASAVSTAAA